MREEFRAQGALAPTTVTPNMSQANSSLLLALPVEVRLEIYSHLGIYNDLTGRSYNVRGRNIESPVYADLFRHGRMTYWNSIHSDVVDVSHTCYQIREEVIDAFYSNWVWVIEASLDTTARNSLPILPNDLRLPRGVQRLLILTTLNENGGSIDIKGSDLLQRISTLREVRIVYGRFDNVFRVPGQDPITDFIQSFPASVRVHVGADHRLKTGLLSALGQNIRYAVEGVETDLVGRAASEVNISPAGVQPPNAVDIANASHHRTEPNASKARKHCTFAQSPEVPRPSVEVRKGRRRRFKGFCGWI